MEDPKNTDPSGRHTSSLRRQLSLVTINWAELLSSLWTTREGSRLNAEKLEQARALLATSVAV